MGIHKLTFLDVLKAREAGWPALNAQALERTYQEARDQHSSWALLGPWRVDQTFDQNCDAYAALEVAMTYGAALSTILLGCYRGREAVQQEPWLVVVGITRARLESLLQQGAAAFSFWADSITNDLLIIEESNHRHVGQFHAGLIAQHVAERSGRTFLGFEDPLQPWTCTPARDPGTESTDAAETRSVRTLVKRWFGQLDELFKSDERIAGITTGLSQLDRPGGISPGELCVLAGLPDSGKTALAISAGTAAARAGADVLYVPLGDTAATLCERMLIAQSSVQVERLRRGELERSDLSSLMTAASSVSSLSISVNDGNGAPMSTIRLRDLVSRWRSQVSGKPGLVIVDHVQLLHGEERARSLFELAREFDVALFALAQYGGKQELQEFTELDTLSTATLMLSRPRPPRRTHMLMLMKHRRSRRSCRFLEFNQIAGRFEPVEHMNPKTGPE